MTKQKNNLPTPAQEVRLEVSDWLVKHYPQVFDEKNPYFKKNIWEEFDKYKKNHEAVHNALRVKLSRMNKKENFEEKSVPIRSTLKALSFYACFSLLFVIFMLSCLLFFDIPEFESYCILTGSLSALWMFILVRHFGPQPGG